MIVVYVSRAEIPVTPVSQSFDVMLPSGTYWVIFAHDVFTFSHSAFIVLSLWTPNVDNARESNSDKFSLALSKQSDNNAVHDVRTCSNLAFWAILICANASSTNAVQTSFDIVWQFFIAGSKYIFFAFRYDTNCAFAGVFAHESVPVGRTIKFDKFIKSGDKNASPVVGLIYRPEISKHFVKSVPHTFVFSNMSNIFDLHVKMSSELFSW